MEQSISMRVFLWSNAIFAASFPFSNAVFNVAAGFWALSSILVLVQYKCFSISALRNNKVALAFLVLFATVAFATLYSSEKAEATFLLERISLFVFAPFLLLATQAFEDKQKIIKFAELGFIGGVSAVLLFAFGVAIQNFIPKGDIPGIFEDLPFHLKRARWYFTYQVFAKGAGVHAVYFSTYLVLGFFLLLRHLKETTIGWLGRVFKFLLILFGLGIFLLKSANVSFSFLLLGLIYLAAYPEILARREKLWTISIGAAALFAMGILLLKAEVDLLSPIAIVLVVVALVLGLLLPKVLKRFSHLTPLPNNVVFTGLVMFILAGTLILPQIEVFADFAEQHPSNVAARYWNWRSATDLILEQPILGLGTGESTAALLEKYEAYGFEAGVEHKFNEHSQYLRYWLDGGLLCLFAFLWLLYEMFGQATEKRYFPMLVLLILVIFFCITESALVRRSFICLTAYFGVLYSYATVGFGKRQKEIVE